MKNYRLKYRLTVVYALSVHNKPTIEGEIEIAKHFLTTDPSLAKALALNYSDDKLVSVKVESVR